MKIASLDVAARLGLTPFPGAPKGRTVQGPREAAVRLIHEIRMEVLARQELECFFLEVTAGDRIGMISSS